MTAKYVWDSVVQNIVVYYVKKDSNFLQIMIKFVQKKQKKPKIVKTYQEVLKSWIKLIVLSVEQDFI